MLRDMADDELIVCGGREAARLAETNPPGSIRAHDEAVRNGDAVIQEHAELA
jgi:hypothetical protein